MRQAQDDEHRKDNLDGTSDELLELVCQQVELLTKEETLLNPQLSRERTRNCYGVSGESR